MQTILFGSTISFYKIKKIIVQKYSKYCEFMFLKWIEVRYEVYL